MSPLGVIASSGPTVLWYLARGAGLAALVLLTISVVVGTVTSIRWKSPRWPRFATQRVHRNASLIALVLIGVHITAVIVDGFAPIGWKDAVVPFGSSYRPFWLGFGAVGFDLVVALLVTTALRRWIGYRTWRYVHWLAYLCWPVIVVHGLGSGTDSKLSVVLVVNVLCVAAVLGAVWWRLVAQWPDRAGAQWAGAAIGLVAPLALVVWMLTGPLESGWAVRAGTPAALLGRGASSGSAASVRTEDGLPVAPFTAELSGTITRSQARDTGLVTLRVVTQLSAGASGSLDLDLVGAPTQAGGIALQASQVTLGSSAHPDLYQGQVTDVFDDGTVSATVRSATATLHLTISVGVGPDNRVSGSLQVEPARVQPRSSSSRELDD